MRALSARVRWLAACLSVALAVAVALLVVDTTALADEAENDKTSSQQDSGALIDTFVASTTTEGLAVLSSTDGNPTVERYYGAVAGASVGSETRFDWGRCSDLIVWASVMQLVEQGQVSLSDHVSQLLPEPVSLPAGYDSLSIADLMDHTAGLDVAMIGSRSTIPSGSASVIPAFALFDVEADRQPGDEVAYTPYDALLAAAIVEEAAGIPFCDYARECVMGRLGLDSVEFVVGGGNIPGGISNVVPGVSLDLSRGLSGLGIQTSTSIQTTSSGSVFGCTGTAGDLLRLAEGLIGIVPDDVEPLFSDATSRLLFTTSRTYPSLGIARVAHGMFAFPLAPGVYGISASTSSDFSAAVYMNRQTGFAVVVLTNESNRFDLVQGIPRLFVGRSDSLSAQPAGPDNATWAGTYQDASKPDHGPAKLLTALTRNRVGTDEIGTLTFDGLTATSLGAGVYSLDTAADQDVYRFHVGLERGSEFSRATSDSYIVSSATLTIEAALLIGVVVGLLVSLLIVVGEVVGMVLSRFHHRRPRPQLSVVILSLATCVAGGAAYIIITSLASGLAPSTLGAWSICEALYVAVSSLLAVWIVYTRIRSARYSGPQRAVSMLAVISALAVVANLVYWEMLP